MENKKIGRKFLNLLKGRPISKTPTLRKGDKVNLQGIGDVFDGEYYIAEVSHSFSESKEYTVQFTCTRQDLGSD